MYSRWQTTHFMGQYYPEIFIVKLQPGSISNFIEQWNQCCAMQKSTDTSAPLCAFTNYIYLLTYLLTYNNNDNLLLIYCAKVLRVLILFNCSSTSGGVGRIGSCLMFLCCCVNLYESSVFWNLKIIHERQLVENAGRNCEKWEKVRV